MNVDRQKIIQQVASALANMTPAQWLAEIDKEMTRAEAAEQLVEEYENAITFDTTCLSCAKVLASSIKDLERAEKAEQLVREQAAGNLKVLATVAELEAKLDAIRELRERYFGDDGECEPEDRWRFDRDLCAILDGEADG